MNFRIFFTSAIFLFSTIITRADEGMWLPYLMSNSQIEQMQKLGLAIPFDSVYNPDKPSLKDAVVALDKGSCTAEFISPNGLLLTNHHCGYENIQEHSTVDHDYLKDGFWAKTMKEELPNPGKTATILIDAKDMTGRFLALLNDTMPEPLRISIVDSLTSVIEDSVENATKLEASVKGFFNGNMYLLFITQTFKDVRLVGAPPSAIGKFGGDTDNWMWPRHTGDFSIFRVYCAPDGSPAEYSENNVPFKPKDYLKISIDGISENDYAMIMGYPGSTDRYMTSYGIKQIEEYVNPVIAEVRGIKQDIWKKEMRRDPKIRIQYAAKYSESSNYWKYSIGQNEGLKHMNVIENREKLEKKFSDWVAEDTVKRKLYVQTLPMLQASYLLTNSIQRSSTIAEETVLAGADLPLFCLNMYFYFFSMENLDKNSDEYRGFAEMIEKEADKFYKDFNAGVDEKVFAAMLKYYIKNVEEKQRAKNEDIFPKRFKGDFVKFTNDIYSNTIFADKETFLKTIREGDFKKINKDKMLAFSKTVLASYFEITSLIDQFDIEIEKSMRQYEKGLFAIFPHKDFYPDANSTFRLTYGTVGSYDPSDAVVYDYRTTLKGVMEKEKPGDPDFEVPERLKKLYAQKDFGRYADKDGSMQVCFITNNDITGGNSGSPVMNKDGNLIGIAFDGNWEAMTGDLAYDKKLQKTICVDIRYVLFVIDKYAGAKNLIEEMTITSAPSNDSKEGA